MGPPLKPTTPQSNTLFNYFARTPTATPTMPSRGTRNEEQQASPSTQPPSQEPPQSSRKNPPTHSQTTTPKSSRGFKVGRKSDGAAAAASKGKKRRLSEEMEDEENKKEENSLDEQCSDEDMDTVGTSAKKEQKSSRGRITASQAKKKVKVIESSDDEDEENLTPEEGTPKSSFSKKAKGKRRNQIQSDSEDEYRPGGNDDEDEEESDEGSVLSEMDVDETSSLDEGSDIEDEPKRRGSVGTSRFKKPNGSTTPKLQSSKNGKSFKDRLSQFSHDSSGNTPRTGESSSVSNPTGEMSETSDRSDNWPHLKYDFLRKGQVCDAKRRKENDPDYDPKTLWVPEQFLNKQTPAVRQWWDFKRTHYDTMLFFKLGKFYELYHMDAVIAAEECQLLYMKGDVCHVGFPETSYSRYANMLIERGHKIARIEQTETPEMRDERKKEVKGKGPSDKVVKRALCQISTKGVRMPSIQDEAYTSPFTAESRYLYGISEKMVASGPSSFGVCFIDTTIGEFHIGQFEDDRHYSRLRTLLAHYKPAHILVKKGNLGLQTDQLITSYADAIKDALPPKDFWSATEVLKKLREDNYFYDESINDIKWPAIFDIISQSGMAPEDGWELGLHAFGGVVSYLKECLVWHDLLSLKKFSLYKPVDSLTIAGPVEKLPVHVVLDGISLQNLDIKEGSKNLLSFLDSSNTPFGKRLLNEWVCMPTAIPDEIEGRLDAIEEIQSAGDFKKEVAKLLKSLPDLERLLNKVHIIGSYHRKFEHPESKAVMFEEKKYSKNKIADLLSIIKGFKTCTKILDLMKDSEFKSSFLSNIMERFPDLSKLLHDFDTAFDHTAAMKEGTIIPKSGVVQEFDEIMEEIALFKNETENYLKTVGSKLKSKVKYFGSEKKAFQLEVPDTTRVDSTFELSSSKKGYKRYVNSTTKGFMTTALSNESKRKEILKDITRKVFEKFDKSHDVWKQAVDCVAKLDVILSLTHYSFSQVDMCRPKVVYSDVPFITIKDGRHPCMPVDVYIANSCSIGNSETNGPDCGSFILLTGPNMGGKSTLMRQVALLTVLSHLGCYVPATVCEMSVVDRIFTRLGAADNIGEGESTFFVELSETSAVLKHCTKNSLVLMDELGRGTATYDGTAIAFSVSSKLADVGIRTLFSTHYHTLVESIQHLPSVQLGHMACMVENENEEDPTQETITFLYKLTPGPCPKSYGFNAARLAGIPDEVIRCAHQKAKDFEASNNNLDILRKIASKTFCLDTALKLLRV